MTVLNLNLNNALPLGVTYNYEPPCKGTVFPQAVLEDLFTKQLPTFLTEIREKWEGTTETWVTGLASTSSGGPIDQCLGQVGFDHNRFIKHGGPIPIMGGAVGSRGKPEQWPYQKANWTQIGTQWVNSNPTNNTNSFTGHLGDTNNWAKPKWSHMFWGTTPVTQQTGVDTHAEKKNIHSTVCNTVAAGGREQGVPDEEAASERTTSVADLITSFESKQTVAAVTSHFAKPYRYDRKTAPAKAKARATTISILKT